MDKERSERIMKQIAQWPTCQEAEYGPSKSIDQEVVLATVKGVACHHSGYKESSWWFFSN